MTNSSGWCAVVWFVMFLHLTAYLSILIKWGALPLAIFLTYCAMTATSALTFLFWAVVGFRGGASSQFAMFLPAILVGIVGTLICHIGIYKRIEALAGR